MDGFIDAANVGEGTGELRRGRGRARRSIRHRLMRHGLGVNRSRGMVVVEVVRLRRGRRWRSEGRVNGRRPEQDGSHRGGREEEWTINPAGKDRIDRKGAIRK